MKNKELAQKVIHFLSLNSDLQHGPMDRYELQVDKLIHAMQNSLYTTIKLLTIGYGPKRSKRPFYYEEIERIEACVLYKKWNIVIGCNKTCYDDWSRACGFMVKDGFETWHDAEIYFNSMDEKRCSRRVRKLYCGTICEDPFNITLK